MKSEEILSHSHACDIQTLVGKNVTKICAETNILLPNKYFSDIFEIVLLTIYVILTCKI